MRAAALTSVVVHGLALAVLARLFERETHSVASRQDLPPLSRARPSARPTADARSIEIVLVTFAAEPVLVPPTIESPTVEPSASAQHRVTAEDRGTGRAAALDDRTRHVGDTGLRMRGGEPSPAIGADATGDVLERIAAAPGHVPQRSGVIAAGDLRVSHGEDVVIHDEVTDLVVHADGTVAFHDKADIDLHFGLPILTPAMWRAMKQEVGESLSRWYADPSAQTHVDGDINDRAEPTIMPSPLPVIFGQIDITSWAMRKAGIDPYASRKLALLDRTRDERVARGLAYREHQLEFVETLMRQNLRALWAATIDANERRAQLFELWDECGESQGAVLDDHDAALDDKRDEAGRRARAEVIHWIRTRLPAGSLDAYSATETAALNARRRSKQMFVPYPSE